MNRHCLVSRCFSMMTNIQYLNAIFVSLACSTESQFVESQQDRQIWRTKYKFAFKIRICTRLPIGSGLNKIYVGSTCSFEQKKGRHKNTYNNENSKDHNCKAEQYIRSNLRILSLRYKVWKRISWEVLDQKFWSKAYFMCSHAK